MYGNYNRQMTFSSTASFLKYGSFNPLPSISTLLFINCSEFNFLKIVCYRIPNTVLNVIYKDVHCVHDKMASKTVIKNGLHIQIQTKSFLRHCSK